jgi:uncharacterized protein YbbC (DUF1343 family)
MTGRVSTGVDVLLQEPRRFLGPGRVGLITNQTGVTADLTSTIDALHRSQDVDLRALFGPEHGARGDLQDALPVKYHIDGSTGLPIHSLFGDALKPTPEMLEGLDVLVFDIQDVGCRFYTYPSTMAYAMEAAAENGLSFIVLDRPDPINGVAVEGNLRPDFSSFVGLHRVPIRHGMTIGELAGLINEGVGADLSVVEMRGWSRGMWFDETGLPWVQPSPNIPTLDTATVYPGTCLFEGVNVSEGRGTTRPFEYVGAPWIDGGRWAEELNALGLNGVRFRACSFIPTFDRYVGERCGGVQVHVTDRDGLRPVEAGLHMLQTVLSLHEDELEWLPPEGGGLMHFDMLAGTDALREDLMGGKAVGDIVGGWREELEGFMELRRGHLLYPEAKQVD